MNKNSNSKENVESDVQKQNEDLPNIPASSEKIKSGKTTEKQIKETSRLNQDGKTDNSEKHNNE